MANIAHASLTGAELHEPKGVATAALGEVYVADGTGSGNWANVGTSSFTGMIADFTWPIVQSGWLELDGSSINTTTYSALYDVMTIQRSGTRTSGSPILTSFSSVAGFRVGYYVFGTGIAAGTTILSVDSASQITLSANASSSGTSTVVVSPWYLDTGTIRLPDLTTGRRYRRSRALSGAVGALEADQNQSHTHTATTTATTDSQGSHTHTATVTESPHVHTIDVGSSGGGTDQVTQGVAGIGATVTGPVNSAVTGLTVANSTNGAHTHTITAATTVASSGSSEARPITMVVMTCVKT